jgi:transketolase
MSEQKQNSKIDLRKPFFEELIKLAEQDDKIVLIVPDVGFSFTDEFAAKFPTRYYNLGVTEQSCVIIAAGMALSGMKPYVYTMINFVAFRPFEMVRNAVACHNANVKLLGVSGSEKYKFLGFSHNLLFEDEDIYHLKPYLKCYKPSTEEEVKNIIENTYFDKEMSYIRL